MRNRDLVTTLLERLEGELANLRRLVRQSAPLSEYMAGLERAEELIEQVKSMVDNEPAN